MLTEDFPLKSSLKPFPFYWPMDDDVDHNNFILWLWEREGKNMPLQLLLLNAAKNEEEKNAGCWRWIFSVIFSSVGILILQRGTKVEKWAQFYLKLNLFHFHLNNWNLILLLARENHSNDFVGILRWRKCWTVKIRLIWCGWLWWIICTITTHKSGAFGMLEFQFANANLWTIKFMFGSQIWNKFQQMSDYVALHAKLWIIFS